MSADESKRQWLPVAFSASNVLQLLAAMASFLAAYVLPANYPELEGPPQYLLLVLGAGFLVVMVLSMLLRPWLTVIAQKIGIRSRMLLPREGIVYLGIMLVIAVAALTGGNPDTGNMLLLIFGMMAGPFVFNGWVVVGMLARVTVTRHLPGTVSAGAFFSVEIRMKNEKRLLSSRLVEVRDVIQGQKVRSEGRVIFVRVAPGEQRSAHYDICISRRGVYQFGPLRLSSRFPLGIGERGHILSASGEVVVHPKIGRLLPAWKRRERELAESASRANARQGFFDDEFHSIRAYRLGDNPRAIHWRSSARHGHIMVKQHEQHRDADLIVLVDLFSVPEFSEQLQERAISLAATICVEQTRQSSSGLYRLMVAGKQLHNVECSGSGRFRDAALRELAVCESSSKAQLASMLLAVCQSQLAPNSRFVLITPRPEAARLLTDSIAQENLINDQQFIRRLLIVTADKPNLDASLVMDLDTNRLYQHHPPTAGELTVTARATTERDHAHRSESAGTDSESSNMDACDRQLQTVFFRSISLTTALAGLVLCRSEGNFLPSGLTPVFAVLAWIFVDHLKWIRLPTWLVNVCGLAALWMAAGEFSQGSIVGKLISGGHMLVYLTWIVLMMQKGHRQFWWLLALTLLQMAVAAVLQTGVFFGGSMLIMMALLLWTLSVFSLYRVMDQHLGLRERLPFGEDPATKHSASGIAQVKINESVVQVRQGLQRDSSETWVGWRFRGLVSGSFLVSLVLAVFVFAAFPRVWVQGSAVFAGDAASEGGLGSQSGFTETVTLGQIGRIRPSQQRVMVFSVTNLNTRKSVSAEQFADAVDMDEVRFRGNALGRYHNGQWEAGFRERTAPVVMSAFDPVGNISGFSPEFRVDIIQDPPVGTFLFVPFPVSRLKMDGIMDVQQRPVTGAFIWTGNMRSNQQRTFTVECPRVDPASDVNPTFEYWTVPQPATPEMVIEMIQRARRLARRLYVAPDIADEMPRLHKLARELCSKEGTLIPESDRVRAVLQFLNADNGFSYSTNQTRQDRTIDPVEDFLFNTKSGHCEYYASACALLLQSAQVPARLVNGYYGSDINSMTGKNEVRQRHAHTWVEAFVNGRWQTLEPTPAAPRREMVSAGEATSLVSNLQMAISDLWNDGIHKMSAERQKEFFAPVIATSKSMFDRVRQQGLLNTLWSGIQSFLISPEAWLSWRGGMLTFLMLLVSGLIYRLRPLVRLRRTLQALRMRFSEKQRAGRSVIRFYAGFCALCQQHGLRLPATNSALENGQTAMIRFEDRLQNEELRHVPIRIANAFNAVRFGHAALTDEQATSIGKDLTEYARALSNSKIIAGAG